MGVEYALIFNEEFVLDISGDINKTDKTTE